MGKKVRQEGETSVVWRQRRSEWRKPKEEIHGWSERGHEVSGHLKRGYGGRGWGELVSVWDRSEQQLKAEVQI